MIHRYRHLIPDYGEKSNDEKQDRLTIKGIFDHMELRTVSRSMKLIRRACASLERFAQREKL